MSKPRLLDTFCGAGGCTKGYQRAGFYVVGVDNQSQKRYCGDEFYQANALDFIREHGRELDVIHASPPCQAYGRTERLWNREYHDLLVATRTALQETGRPYIIENVPGAKLINPIMLNGAMFGLLVHRNRLFETSFEMPFTLLPSPSAKIVKMGRRVREGEIIQPVGNFSGVDYARKEMGINWMTQHELSQAIPPAYTEWLGLQLREALGI